MIPYTITLNGITFIINKPYTINSDNIHFELIKDAVIRGDKDEVLELVNIPAFIAKFTQGNIRISDDEVYYKTNKVYGYLAERILDLMRSNESLDSILNFAEKLMSNPSEDVRTDLYKWMEKGNMPVYPDGDFAAYKVVRSDFTSIFTGPYGKIQAPGTFVEMPRNECDDDRNNTCSSGLHFCSYEYLSLYSEVGNAILLLKINPKDVVSIPTDYNLTKGRACKYFVVDCINKEVINQEIKKSPVIQSPKITVKEVETTEKPSTVFTRKGETFNSVDILRLLEDMSVAKAAEKLGVPRSTLSDWIKRI